MLLAEQLLNTMYDLEHLESINNWDNETLKSNPPRYLRLQQISAMMKFLGFNCTPKEFKRIPLNQIIICNNEDIFVDILNNMRNPLENIDKFKSIGDIVVTFWYLYEFRKNFHNSFESSLISEGIGNYSIGEKMLEYLKETLTMRIDWVDNMLFFIIDPKKQEFNIELLVEKYDYPNVNIHDIDSDWI